MDIKAAVRQSCTVLSGKFLDLLTSATAKPISPHIGFSPLRTVLPMIMNSLRSPALMNVLRSPIGIMTCLGCVIAMTAISFGQQQKNSSHHTSTGPQLPVTSRMEPSRGRDVPLS